MNVVHFGPVSVVIFKFSVSMFFSCYGGFILVVAAQFHATKGEKCL